MKVFGLILNMVFAALAYQGHAQEPSLETKVIRQLDRGLVTQPWGDFKPYFRGEAHTAGGVMVNGGQINPGEWPHPPHQHVGEEIIHILSGEGEWLLNGETIPAKAGDMVFVKSWDMHTLKNTGKIPIHFLVVFLSGKQEEN